MTRCPFCGKAMQSIKYSHFHYIDFCKNCTNMYYAEIIEVIGKFFINKFKCPLAKNKLAITLKKVEKNFYCSTHSKYSSCSEDCIFGNWKRCYKIERKKM